MSTDWLNTILEIIKITVPALVVFLTVRTLMQQYLGQQLQLQRLDIQQKQLGQTLPLKLQAYERLVLLCERISIPQLLMRLRPEGLTVAEMRLQMMLAAQQELEHNVTQQVYVSDQLWQIVALAYEETINLITKAAEAVPAKAPATELVNALLSLLDQRSDTIVDKARGAIRKEASLILG